MGQRKSWDSEPGLREYLLAECVAFSRSMCTTLAENPDWSREAWTQLSHSIDQLASGGEYRCRAWELPDDHPARQLGMQRDWVLGSDDVLRRIE
jgi:hypothetical protein